MKHVHLLLIALLSIAVTTPVRAQTCAQPATPIAPTTPGTPQVSLPVGNGSLTVSWAASAQGTGIIQGYTVVPSPAAPSAATGLNPTGATTVVSGLTNGTAYTFTVFAVSSDCSSASSAPSAPATPLAPVGQVPGTWVNVTPSGLPQGLSLPGQGVGAIALDPGVPSDVYAQFFQFGIYVSHDYGQTWAGPIDSGSTAKGEGFLQVARLTSGGPPIFYLTGYSADASTGFASSLDGGATWTHYTIGAFPLNRQDCYPVVIDPYDPLHLLLPAHEQNIVAQSVDGGHTWAAITQAAGMTGAGVNGTANIAFIDTGNAAITRFNWIWLGQTSGATYRTTDGITWTQVSGNTHSHGQVQPIWQPDTSGVVFMGGIYSAQGSGVFRSSDYGMHWTPVATNTNQGIVYGTKKAVYAEWGWPYDSAHPIPPSLETAPLPAITGWTLPATPAAMVQGPAQAIVTYDPSGRAVVVTANWFSGLWRFVEP